MKRNDLLAKGLTLGLAVATAATSMAVPGGFFAPEAVYADEGQEEGAEEAAVSFETEKYAVGEELTVSIKSEDTSKTYEYTWYHVNKDTEESAELNDSNKIADASAKTYKIAKDYVGERILVVVKENGQTEEIGRALSNVITYAALPDETKVTYNEEETKKASYNKSVTIAAAKDSTSYKITDDAEKISSASEESYEFTAPESGVSEETKTLYFVNGDDVYQEEITINFDLEAPTIKDEKVTERSASGAKISVTPSEGGKLYYVVKDAETTWNNAEAVTKDSEAKTVTDVTADTAKEIEITGKTANTTYYVYIVAEDAAGNLSEIATVPFKTEKTACAVTAPKFEDNAYDATNHTLKATVASDIEASALEYSLDGGETWTKGGEGSVLTVADTTATIQLEKNKAYAANTIQIRVAETDNAAAGDAVTYDKAITATLQGTVTLSGTYKYGGTITATVSGAQEDAQLTYEFIRVKDSTDNSDTDDDSKNDENGGSGAAAAAETAEGDSETEGPANTYTITKEDIGAKIQVKVTAEGYEKELTAETETAIAKADAREVSEPEVASFEQQEDGTFTYTLKALEDEDARYAVVESGAEETEKQWQTSPEFTGLQPETTYIFYVTYAANDCYEDSTEASLEVTTPKFDTSKPQDAPEAAGVDVTTNADATAYQLKIADSDDADALEYSVDQENWKSKEEIEALEWDADQTITVSVRKKAYTTEDGTAYKASPAVDTAVTTPSASTAPVITGEETFNDKTSVTITAEGTIYYTTDGSAPVIDAAHAYVEPFDVSATTTVKAVAVEDGKIVSAAAEQTFTKADAAEDNGGTDNGGTDNGGTDNGGTDNGGTDNGGTDNGGTDNGGTDNGGTDNGGTNNGGTNNGGTNNGGTNNGGTNNGGTNNSGTNNGGSTGSDSTNTNTSTSTTPAPSTDTTTKTETKADGTQVTTTETKAADGSVNTTTALKNDATGLDASVTVAKDAQGNVTSASATATVKAAGKKTTIAADAVAQITEAAGTKDVAITSKVVDDSGNTVREVTVNAKNLTAGKNLKVVKIDKATGEKTLVNKSTYKVAADGSLSMGDLADGSYEVVTVSAANTLSKAVLNSVKVQNTKKNVAVGKKTKIALSKDLNMDNVAKITYKTGKKSVAVVNTNGTITTKKAGKTTVKATVTLKNGKKKTVKMVVTVKAAK